MGRISEIKLMPHCKSKMTFIEAIFNIKQQLFQNEVNIISSGPIKWNNKWETIEHDFSVFYK